MSKGFAPSQARKTLNFLICFTLGKLKPKKIHMKPLTGPVHLHLSHVIRLSQYAGTCKSFQTVFLLEADRAVYGLPMGSELSFALMVGRRASPSQMVGFTRFGQVENS